MIAGNLWPALFAVRHFANADDSTIIKAIEFALDKPVPAAGQFAVVAAVKNYRAEVIAGRASAVLDAEYLAAIESAAS